MLDSLINKHSHYQAKCPVLENEKNKDDSKMSCKIPKLNPFHPSMVKLLKNIPMPQCTGQKSYGKLVDGNIKLIGMTRAFWLPFSFHFFQTFYSWLFFIVLLFLPFFCFFCSFRLPFLCFCVWWRSHPKLCQQLSAGWSSWLTGTDIYGKQRRQRKPSDRTTRFWRV